VEVQLSDALLVLEHATDAVFVNDDQFRIVWANEAASALTGYSREWLMSHNIADLMVPEDLARTPFKLRELREGKRMLTERTLKRADGNIIVCEVSSRQLPDGRIVGLARDVTGRAAAAVRLARSEASFRSLAESLPVGVAIHRGGRIVFVNQVVVQTLGYDAKEDVIGMPVIEIVHPESRPAVFERLVALSRGTHDVPFNEERILRRDGSSLMMDVAAATVEFEGEPAVAVVTRDLSERNRLQARLAQADRMASIGTLAAGIAHEVNNPLAYVTLNLEAALRDLLASRERGEPAGADVAERIDAALEGAGRVRDIVSNLRRFARMDETPRGPTIARRAVDAAIKLIDHELKLRARLVRQVTTDAAVDVNEGQLTQVLVNLLANATHAIPEGHADTNVITIRCWDDGDDVRIEVSDSGVGIAPDMLSRIFDPFFTSKPVGTGTGLGLSICHGIVTSAGGRIEATSELGRGTTITIRLPGVELGEATERDARLEGVDAPPVSARAPRHRVLLVDDEAAIRTVIAKILEQEDYEVEQAASGSAAIARLSKGPDVDVIMCDLTMPDVSGGDVFRWICEHRPRLRDRVIFVSGADDELAARFPERWLDKPFTIDGLLRAVSARLVAGKR
jgi:PAS domain S-box-containing protein